MNKAIFTAILVLFTHCISGQKGIDNLIKAEKEFAAYSVTHSTKEAFEQFIDSNSIMFDEGKPLKAIEFWRKRQKNPGVLNWFPQYAEISTSEDFGYTTGPWTYRSSKTDTVVARGQYSTVWQLDKNGKWKFLVDFGIDNTQPNMEEERIVDAPKYPDRNALTSGAHPLLKVDNRFNTLLLNNKKKAYSIYLSRESILTRNGSLPATTSVERGKRIDATPNKLEYKRDGWGVSVRQDMGYTYGSVMVAGKPQNYMRIWRHEEKGWRLALEVLRY